MKKIMFCAIVIAVIILAVPCKAGTLETEKVTANKEKFKTLPYYGEEYSVKVLPYYNEEVIFKELS